MYDELGFEGYPSRKQWTIADLVKSACSFDQAAFLQRTTVQDAVRYLRALSTRAVENKYTVLLNDSIELLDTLIVDHDSTVAAGELSPTSVSSVQNPPTLSDALRCMLSKHDELKSTGRYDEAATVWQKDKPLLLKLSVFIPNNAGKLSEDGLSIQEGLCRLPYLDFAVSHMCEPYILDVQKDGQRSTRAAYGFLQSWLYFGTLHEIFGILDIKIDLTNYINNEEGSITTRHLTTHLSLWAEKEKKASAESRTQRIKSINAILRTAMAMVNDFEDDSLLANEIVDMNDLMPSEQDLAGQSADLNGFVSKVRIELLENSSWIMHLHGTPYFNPFLSIWYGISWRTTSKPEDETICVGTLLGLDVGKITETPTAPDHQITQMKRLLTLQGRFPDSIIFGDFARMHEDGFRWGPQSFLVHGRLNYIKHPTVGPFKSSKLTDRGLLVKFPGLILPSATAQIPIVDQKMFGLKISPGSIPKAEGPEDKILKFLTVTLVIPKGDHANNWDFTNQISLAIILDSPLKTVPTDSDLSHNQRVGALVSICMCNKYGGGGLRQAVG
ncbi:hypothetical protein FOBRF1_000008 [Fusarium oxysporum]